VAGRGLTDWNCTFYARAGRGTGKNRGAKIYQCAAWEWWFFAGKSVIDYRGSKPWGLAKLQVFDGMLEIRGIIGRNENLLRSMVGSEIKGIDLQIFIDSDRG
jgi:hypothetical protein